MIILIALKWLARSIIYSHLNYATYSIFQNLTDCCYGQWPPRLLAVIFPKEVREAFSGRASWTVPVPVIFNVSMVRSASESCRSKLLTLSFQTNSFSRTSALIAITKMLSSSETIEAPSSFESSGLNSIFAGSAWARLGVVNMSAIVATS